MAVAVAAVVAAAAQDPTIRVRRRGEIPVRLAGVGSGGTRSSLYTSCAHLKQLLKIIPRIRILFGDFNLFLMLGTGPREKFSHWAGGESLL